MGKNNKARRAAKSRQKVRQGTPRSRGEREPYDESGPAGESSADRVASTWYEALMAREQAPQLVPGLVAVLARLPEALVERHAEWLLRSVLGDVWRRGWQPAEVRRQVRIATRAQTVTLAELAMHAEHAGRTGKSIDPRWADQIAGLGERTRSVQGPWLTEWRERHELSRMECYDAVLVLCRVIGELRPIDILIPYPGAPISVVTIGAPTREVGAHPMLERIRKLLAKAEATEFEEEAATFTAKAQQLMTRYAIDEARVHQGDIADVPRMIRVPIDAPYADTKGVLLDVVARANRCRAIQLGGCHMSSVFGHAGDLGVVELMFTSLLVQAQKGLAEVGRRQVGGRTRSASYRSSFLLAYARRIGERLNAATGAVLDEDANASALPVLRSREAAVEDLIEKRYGDSLVSSSVRGGYDPLGHAHGRHAADEAKLDSGELTA
jgi:hypothetical protein